MIYLSKFEKKMTNQLQGTKVTKFDFICKVCRKIRQRPLAPKSQSVKFDKPIFYVQCPKENNICQGPFPLAFHLVCPDFAKLPTPLIISMQQREVIYGSIHFCVHKLGVQNLVRKHVIGFANSFAAS